ncbi:protein ECT2 isoform X2 [Halyomorpha halys]|uniref:protein ECT2 isoform X2 n=1 Tax=Halyomorpha halys TaxID=286706 RepID=UPI0006D4CF29|nr:protein ECT2 isoform X2 [Halyomorpha halys]
MEGAKEEAEANVIVEKPMECSDVEEDLAMLDPSAPECSKIWLIGDIAQNDTVLTAAKVFKVDIESCDEDCDLEEKCNRSYVFVMEEFSGPVFDYLKQHGQRVIGPTALQELAEKESCLPELQRPLYCQAMAGVVVCFTGFRKKEELARLILLIHHMGGSIRKDMITKVTHLIANCCGGEKYQYATAFRVPIMSASWVHNSWAMRNQPGFSAVAHGLAEHRLKAFHGARVCFLGFPEDERQHMADILAENGGVSTDIADPACTHVVCDSTELVSATPGRAYNNNETVTSIDSTVETPKRARTDSTSRMLATGFTSPNPTCCWQTPPTVVDESTTSALPASLPTRAYLVKAEWFWASVQNEYCVDEKDHLFQEYVGNNTTPRVSISSTPGSSRNRKRKRLRANLARVISPASCDQGKRRSSVTDATLLSCSGSFLDSSPLPEEECNDGAHLKNLSARHQVFLELLQTESNYVGILNTIMTMFKGPLEDMLEEEDPLLNGTELKIIFGNLPPIYNCHCHMLEELRFAAHNWTEEISIGSIFLKFAPDLVKAYPPFVNFFETTREMLVKCDEQKPRFHAFLKARQTRAECGRQSLVELLIRPVQRLPSISLLLSDILKHTGKSNSDHVALEKALSSIREVMTHINEDKRKTEGQVVMFDIFNDIDNCPAHLVSSHRSFIIRCEVTELSDSLSGRGDQLVLYLFTDILEVCKKRSKAFNSLKSPSTGMSGKLANIKPYKHIKLISLSTIRKVFDIKETEVCHNVFAMMCRSTDDLKEKLYTFTITDDETEKSLFLKTLCRQMANNACRPDADNFLATLDPKNLDIETSDVGLGTLGKAFKFASRTRMKVGRAFSFNKTPNKLKRAVSTMMSPFGSTTNLTPAATQLAQMRLASCTNISELANNNSPTVTQYVAPLSVQPTRRSKQSSLSVASLRRL